MSETEPDTILHPSHRWGQRPYFERDEPGSNRWVMRQIPCCMNCLTDGFEDEYDAFQPCRSPSPPGRSGTADPEART